MGKNDYPPRVHKTGLPDWATSSPTNDEWSTSPIRFKFKPDSAFSYSGEAFAFLQRAVEQIRGRSLQQIAEEEVFIPFDMSNSSFGWKESYYSKAAYGHDKEGKSTGKEIFPGEIRLIR
ncbi:MAG: beta-lactamase family protein [Prevotellaceae bacterium]|nr:beta-lactamase family protein [Prevotellaceae bacterium]